MTSRISRHSTTGDRRPGRCGASPPPDDGPHGPPMRGLTLFGEGDAPRRVLAVGAHADDIEIGAGGLLLELATARPGLEVTWVVLSGDAERAGEARRSAEGLLGEDAHVSVE